MAFPWHVPATQIMLTVPKKVTEIEVLHASKNGSQKLLLVYASDTAMKYESQKLSGPLRVKDLNPDLSQALT